MNYLIILITFIFNEIYNKKNLSNILFLITTNITLIYII